MDINRTDAVNKLLYSQPWEWKALSLKVTDEQEIISVLEE